MRAIALLSWWQFRNGLLAILRSAWLTVILAAVLAGIGWGMYNLPHLFTKSTGTVSSFADLYLLSYLPQIQAGVFCGVIALSSLNYIALFSGAALQFTLPDVYYLFPLPLSRRVVLLAKMPVYAAGVFWAAVSFFWLYDLMLFLQIQPYLASGFALRAQLAVFLSVFFCLAGYGNLALTLEIVLGVEKIVTFRRIGYPVLGVILAAVIGLSVWKGMDGLIVLARQPVLEMLFYPCYLGAQAALAPFHQRIDGWALAQLSIFAAASTALLFSRRENYYETALRGSEAMAERRESQNKGEFSLGLPRLGRRAPGRDYTLPAFGRGAGALAWAHLTASAKQPYANFLTPLLVGAAPPALTRLPSDADGKEMVLISIFLGYTMLSALTGAANIVFTKAIRLQPLARPFPLPPRLLILADLAPMIVNAVLVGIGAGACTLILRVGHSPRSLAAMFFLCLPAVLVCIYVQCYLFTLLSTTTQDKLRPWLIGTAGYVVTNALFTLLVGVLTASMTLQVPLAISMANCVYVCFVAGALFLALAERAYRKSEPGQS